MRTRAQYAYPLSPEASLLHLEPTSGSRPIPLSQRLRVLQTELLALEDELADPTNPLLQKEREEEHVDPGELIRGLVDVRTRLDKIKKGKEGRARLVNVVVDGDGISNERVNNMGPPLERKDTVSEREAATKSDLQVMVDIDHRVGELEHIVGSSSTMLDEVCRALVSLKRIFFVYFAFLDFSSACTVAPTYNSSQQSTYNSYSTSTYRFYLS